MAIPGLAESITGASKKFVSGVKKDNNNNSTILARDATQVKTYQGISISLNGNMVGRIKSWSPQMYSRGGAHIFELGAISYGRPVDYVPAAGQNYTIECTRTEVWEDEIEVAMGYGLFVDLVSQRIPFTATERLFRRAALTGEELRNTDKGALEVYREWTYYNCWFTNRNEDSFDAQGGAIVGVNLSISFVSRLRTT